MRGFVVGAMAALLFAGTALASSSGDDSRDEAREDEAREVEAREDEAPVDEAREMYLRGQELLEKGHYRGALESFREAHKREKKEPEYLNMVAYTQRKTGDLAGAFDTYEKVLGMKPDFPQAREYLGEAHLQAVLIQIDLLRGYGEDGRNDYDRLVAALQEAAETLSAGNVGETTPVPDQKPW